MAEAETDQKPGDAPIECDKDMACLKGKEEFPLCQVEKPIGDLLFDWRGIRIGFEICRDAWVADRTGARLSQRGADVLLNPSASHFAFAKQQIRERFVLEGSRAFQVSYAYANLLGNEAGRSIYDGGTLIASGGKMLALGPRFSFDGLPTER